MSGRREAKLSPATQPAMMYPAAASAYAICSCIRQLVLPLNGQGPLPGLPPLHLITPPTFAAEGRLAAALGTLLCLLKAPAVNLPRLRRPQTPTFLLPHQPPSSCWLRPGAPTPLRPAPEPRRSSPRRTCKAHTRPRRQLPRAPRRSCARCTRRHGPGEIHRHRSAGHPPNVRAHSRQIRHVPISILEGHGRYAQRPDDELGMSSSSNKLQYEWILLRS